MAVKTNDLSEQSGKLSCFCHESPVGIEEEAISRETTG